MNKQQKMLMIIMITMAVSIVVGATFSYWQWRTTAAQNTNVVLTVASDFSCTADGGGSITTREKSLVPTDCTNSQYAIKKEVTVSTTSTTENEIINVNLDLKIDYIDSALSQSENLKYALSTDQNSCTGGVKGNGSFNGKAKDDTVSLLTNEEFIGAETKTYYLYVWLDKAETDSATMDKNIDLSLSGNCSDSGTQLNKIYAYFGGTSSYFKAAAYRDNITSISIVNNIDVPEGATSWNIGVSPSNASDVVAWLEDDNSGNGTFALKIGANGTIFAHNQMANAFSNMQKVSSINLGGLNTSSTNNMGNMFYYTGYSATTFSLDLGNQFNTSNVKSMRSMFSNTGYSATTFSLDLGNQFNTSNVNNMTSMFSNTGHDAATFSLDLGNQFNTSNVKNMYGMFSYTGYNTKTNFTLDLSAGSFNTSANTRSMFNYFPTSYATIYVKDNDAKNFLLNINSSLNVQIK